jgi:hypothetical protein
MNVRIWLLLMSCLSRRFSTSIRPFGNDFEHPRIVVRMLQQHYFHTSFRVLFFIAQQQREERSVFFLSIQLFEVNHSIHYRADHFAALPLLQ